MVAIEVRKVYHIQIDAIDDDEVEEKADVLSFLTIEEEGSLIHIDTSFIQIEDIEDEEEE
jgi:hypothetical protein